MAQLQDLSIYVLAIRVADVVDMLLVATLVYGLLYVVRGTRAIQLLRGILIVVLIVFVFNQFLSLPAFERVVGKLLPAILISIPVIFQPELRRAFERLGQAGLLMARPAQGLDPSDWITAIATAARHLAEARHGALVVVERETSLEDLADRGLQLDAGVTPELLSQIFAPNTPLHDGAVIVRGGRIAAARVVLPLGDRPAGNPALGTRHLAALSISESTDAVVVVVSEESGSLSLAVDAQLTRCDGAADFARRLHEALAWDAEPIAARRWRTLQRAWRGAWAGGSRRAPGGPLPVDRPIAARPPGPSLLDPREPGP